MSRIHAVDPAQTQGETKDILATLNKALGMTPDLFRVAARSPSVLSGLVGLNQATTRGELSAKARESIALAVAEANRCDYCLSAHTVLGKLAGLTDEQTVCARKGDSPDSKTKAMLTFARRVVSEHGRVSDGDLQTLRFAGVSDGEALEVVANVVLNIFTNYINLVAQTEIDFPAVQTKAA